MTLKKLKEGIKVLEARENNFESAKELNEHYEVPVARSFTIEDGTEDGFQVKPIYNENGLHLPLQTPDGAIWYILVDTETIDNMILDFINRQNNKE